MKNRSVLIFLLFPFLGVIGMILVISGGNGEDESSSGLDVQNFPSPTPFDVPTLRPTVQTQPILNNPAPERPLTNLAGDEFTLADLQGQVVFVNFWATWCPPCVREMPALEQFATDNPDVMVLAITDPNDGQDRQQIDEFIDQYQLAAMDFGFDADGRLRVNFNAINLPMTFVIDTDGVVRFRQIGEVTRDDLDFYLSELQS